MLAINGWNGNVINKLPQVDFILLCLARIGNGRYGIMPHK